MSDSSERRVRLLSLLAYLSVLLSVYVLMVLDRNREPGAWRTPVCLALGVLHFVIVMVCVGRFELSARQRGLYFLVQAIVVAAAILTSPSLGTFAIIALPLTAEAVMALRWPGGTAVVLAMYGTAIVSVALPHGLGAARSMAVSFGPAFCFTVVFALFMRHAMAAREKAERLSNELAAANTRLREQAVQADELATTRERNRLAREIHDGVGHYLTVIKVQLEAARAAFDREPATAQHAITVSERLAGEALDELRHSVTALRTDARRAGLIEDLRQLTHDSEPPPEFVVTGTPRPLPSAIEHALFRVAQEGLTNVRKHARAGHTSVTLDFCGTARVRLAVADDGVGLGAATVQPERGYGLAGLRERVALLGGELRAATRSGGGCVLEVEVPA